MDINADVINYFAIHFYNLITQLFALIDYKYIYAHWTDILKYPSMMFIS